ncbi:MAG: sulfur reduction protein DsrE [Defluviitaleaceae bacterium]|nr:sulfur reduction protein DsrE [Defluviitaleaceae bacterium]
MKVAYLFSSTNSQLMLSKMIIPQMLEDRHGVDVAGMMFFFDNTFLLTKGSNTGEALRKVHEKHDTLLMACDVCAIERGIEGQLIDGAGIGCFPNLYAVLKSAEIEQVITL